MRPFYIIILVVSFAVSLAYAEAHQGRSDSVGIDIGRNHTAYISMLNGRIFEAKGWITTTPDAYVFTERKHASRVFMPKNATLIIIKYDDAQREQGSGANIQGATPTRLAR